MTSQYDYQLKMVLIGDSCVGKTSFFRAFTQQRLEEMLTATIGVDFTKKLINVNDSTVKLLLWDTAGLERFRDLTSNYYRGASAILLFYDTTHRPSFDNMIRWLSSVQGVLAKEDYTLAIVGTKIDLVAFRAIPKEEAEEFAKERDALYFEVCSSNEIDKSAFFKTNNIVTSTIARHLELFKYHAAEPVITITQKEETKEQPRESAVCCY